MARQSDSNMTQRLPMLARLWNSPFAFRNPSLLEELEQGLFEPGFFNERRVFPNGVTIFEKGNQLVVKADVPGLTREEIEITYNKGILNIRTEHREEKEEKQGRDEGDQRQGRDEGDQRQGRGERDQRQGRGKDEREEPQGSLEKRYWSLSQCCSYAFPLPCPVDETKEPTASLDKGVLTLTFNKPQKDIAKRITIK